MLKSLTVFATAAAVLVALPAHAETTKHKKHTAKHKRAHVVRTAPEARPMQRGANVFPVGPLYYNGGVYMGDDPDPFIRSQLWRDVSGRFGGDSN